MNIFFLDKNQKTAVKALTNEHVVKMVLETGQLLSTAHRVLDGEHNITKNRAGHRKQEWNMKDKDLDKKLYKATHFNHPVAIWVRSSKANYMWTYHYFEEIAREFELRFRKTHLTWKKLKDVLSVAPKNIPNKGMTPITPAVLDKYLEQGHKNAMEIYRAYYYGEKLKTEEDYKRYRKYIK